MHKLIQQLIANKPKHFSKSIKSDAELHQWVMQNTKLTGEHSLSAHVYSALHDQTDICSNGSNKKFKSISEGFGFCGPAKICPCAKESVSKSVSAAKQTYTEEQKQAIADKRAATNLEKYGVANIGQTELAKQRHAEFYCDANNVVAAVEKAKQTTLTRYGVENVAGLATTIQKREASLLAKYGVVNAMQSQEVQQKAIATKKERYEPHSLAKMNLPKFIKTVEENFGVTPILANNEYIGVASRPLVRFKCITCAHEFEKRFDYAAPPICKVCNPTQITYKSKEELALLDFCKQLSNTAILSGDRSVIAPYELDIYMPEHNLAIEYCGLYWHSEVSSKKSWNYHYRKYKACAAKGIQLLTFFSDEWLTSPDVVKDLIKSKLNASNTAVWARKCTVKKVPSADAKAFLNENHLQKSPRRLPINYGLYYNNVLHAVMSFASTTNNGYELIRFASKGRVQGGASKLLKHFMCNYSPSEIVSFSNNRYSNGALYKTLGFTEVSAVPPMQEYVYKYATRIHKRGITKYIKETKTSSNTEWEAAQLAGYDRIWDCGKKKWVLTL